jgi:hypothetical protein
MIPVGFKAAIPESERPQTAQTLASADRNITKKNCNECKNKAALY